MNLNKKDVLKILSIIFISIIFLVALINLSSIFSWIEKLLSVLSPFIWGLCFAFVINIPLRLIENRVFSGLNKKGNKKWLRIKRPVSLILSILLLLILISLLVILIIPRFKEALESFATKLPDYMNVLDLRLSELMANFTGEEGKHIFKIDWETISGKLIDFVHSSDVNTVELTIDIVSKVIGGIFDVILGFVFSIYILASKERLGRQFRSVLYSIIKKEKADSFLSVLSISNTSFSRFVAGQCTEAVIIGFLCALGMIIFRMPYVPVISCIIAVTALIPVFGAFIGTAIGAFMILLDSPVKALWFIIYIIVLQQIETNLIYPRVVGKSVGLPGIWVLFAVTVGGGFFGAFGMLVSVPVCSVIYTLLERWVKNRLIKRNIDSDRLNKTVHDHKNITQETNKDQNE